MALRRENYTHMGICILVYVLFILSLSAQDQACPIWADLEPIADQRTATPTIYSQSVSIPFYDWEQLDSSRYSDDQYATVSLTGINRSEMATFSRWGHKIPDGATIHGIKLSIEGHQTGEGKIRDVKVQLQGSNENRAGQYLGVAFPDSIDQVWRYGGADDTWGRSWTASQINSNSFGLIYQVRNSLNSEVTAHIDQITIEVFYTPMYTMCNLDHVCVAFGVDEVQGYNYNWNLPLGFERLSSLNEQYTVNIGPKESTNFGQYNICVDVFDQNGNFAENCCRTFLYKDCRPAIIGNQVFLDNNHDNIFSAGDDPVTNTTVFLYDEFDNLIAMTTTDDEDGMYQFEVEEGNYYVGIALPEGTLPIDPNVGNDNNDSDLDNSNGPLTTQTFYAAPGATIDNVDIGLATELIIGDRVWEDKNYNGIQDTLEVGVADVEVQLIAANGDTLQTTTTDVNGIYGFDGVRVDDYEVRFLLADSYWSTLQNVGAENTDSDIDENGSTGLVDFDLLDMPYLDLDAGFYRFASVGDYVFFDNNENGIQDAGDTPQDSVLVTLSTASGTFIESIFTDESGAFLFDSLTPGTYIITAEGSELIKPTFVQQGNDITVDNDLHNANGSYTTAEFMLMSNEANNDIDLGWRDNLADLGGTVFEDIKYDGQYDAADNPVANILVALLESDGSLVQTQLTDADGQYMFMNVLPGTYYITFGIGVNYQFTQANVGSDITDSDVTESAAASSTDLMIVTVGLEMFDINAGLYQPTSIGDYVFLDLNEDGIQNNGDTGLAGIELYLIDASGNTISIDTTESNGAYTFDNLVPGEYTIELNSPDLFLATIGGQGTSATDSDLIDANGQYLSEVIATCSGQQIDTIDFGFINNYAEISGQLFEDSKADGSLSTIDTLIESVAVMLYDTNGTLVQNTTTDTLGQYAFTEVLAGDYYIVYGLSDDYVYTTSDITNTNGNGSTDNFTLAPGQTVSGLSTGAYVPASVGDYIFLDLDEDGTQSAGDEGLSALVMELRTANGDFVASRGSSDGSYIFSDLVPGDYVINFVKDDLYLPTQSNVGDAETDSDLLEIGNLYTSGVFTLCSGQQIDTIDFGFVNNYAQISGQVFEDSKADGLFTAGDTLISNVVVTLYDALGEIVQTTTTDALGNFTFDDILAGEYYIQYGLSNDYLYSTTNVTGSNGNGTTDLFILEPGAIVTDQITGAYILGSIGDYVFLDLNEDGIQDAGDSGLAGVELSLLDSNGVEVQSTESAANGSYSFDDLLPGTYTIALTNSDLYLSTQSNVGDTETDSDVLGAVGNYTSPEIIICSGQSDQSIDFGFVNDYASIAGQVYEDSKADRIFNAPDTAIVAVPVILYNSSNQLIQSTVTDAEGNFFFEDVLAGDYYIVYGLGSEYIYSTDNVSGANGTGSTNTITLAPGDVITDQSTGAYVFASIGDYVFLDLNENGMQDADDTGLAEIDLSIIDMSGTVIGMTTTGGDGSYLFDNLVPGNYIISVVSSDLYLPTQLNVGDSELDSDLESVMGNYGSSPITVCSGQNENSIDFGFVNDYANISGQVYEDSKADRMFNAPDTALVAVPVTLYNTANEIVQSTTTDTNGSYSFEDVLAGDYYIVYGLGDEYIYSTDNVTGANGIGSTDAFTLIPGEVVSDQSTGAYVLATIGDYVFLDVNEDGIQDADDTGLEGIELSLIDMSGTVINTITTGADGAYSFDNLVPGNYIISAVASNIYLPTQLNVGDDTLDSDLETIMGNFGSSPITVCSGQNEETIDFGFVIDYSSISGQVYEDSKADRMFNAPDTAIVAVPVTLYNSANEIVQSTTTDTNGNYAFDNVLAGEYYIVYGLGDEYIYSTDNVTGANGIGSTDAFTLIPGEVVSDQSTGAYVLATIGDYVFLDVNEDGIQDADDTGLEGIELSLIDMSGTVVNTITTGADGAYSFDNLVPGNYIISAVASNIYLPTQLNVGDDTLDSDLETVMGNYGSSPITVCSGQNEETIDFGFVIDYSSISGQVYEDSKADSLFNGLDTALVNVTVTLYNADNTIAQTTTTDANGNYAFDDVLAGDYYIIYGLDMDYIYTSTLVTQSNGDGSTDVFTLAPGDSRDDGSIGAYLQGSIGDYVFLDLNEDGIQDDTDVGLEGIQLELFDLNGAQIDVTSSDTDGAYSFDNLTPGQYIITTTVSDLYLATLLDVGDDDTDSDLISTNGILTTELITVCSGQNEESIDLGFVNNYAQISGSVFEDAKANGILDTPDTMKVGVVVELYDTDNTLIQSTTTSSDGTYIFDDVLAADYYIVYNLASDYIFSTADVTGSNGTGSTDIISVAPGQSIVNDATGAYLNATIGDLVFLDQDDDGIQGVDDTGLAGVQLSLLNALGLNQGIFISEANGNYSFDNITPGKYIIQAQFSDEYIATTYQVGDENLDSDLLDLGGIYQSDTLDICSGQMIDNIDFGLANNYAKVGGVVFTDMMFDGQQNTIDELLIDIPVTLFDENNVELASTVTDADGSYLFDNLIAGNYYIVFDLGDQLVTTALVGDAATDSDVTGSNGVGSTNIFALAPGECNLTIGAGVYELAGLGDFVWSDDNRNGLQDAGEAGIANVVINLYDESNQLQGTTNTDENGLYGFSDLDPGMYYIEVEYPQDLTATVNVNTDPALNSDITDGNGEGTTDLFNLTSGINNIDIDAGLGLAGAEIHGEVWIDLDGDEMQSAADTLMPGIIVNLFNADTDALVLTSATNQNGTYSFKPLDDGSYYIEFVIPDTLLLVTPSIGTDDVDSDVDGTNGVFTTADISVVIGDVIWDVDAGVKDARSLISGEVFIDKNGDGINDATEINLDTYTVNLYNTDDEIIKSVTSDANGFYTIEDVAPGDYYLTFSIADDYEFTQSDIGDDSTDSDVTDRDLGSTDIFSVSTEEVFVFDAGVYQLGSIGDFVWFDANGNGLQDTDEQGIELANLTILDMAGEAVDIANTGTDGAYLFEGLAPGRYWIFMQAPLGFKATTYQVGLDTEIDSDLIQDGEFLLSDTIMIMSGQNDLSVDFGLVENPGSIEGLVWNDIDLDGQFNDGISTFDAITVELYDSDNTLIETTNTDLDGGYLFSDVTPGDYYIKFVLNDGTTFTIADQGDDNTDSDVIDSDGNTDIFSVDIGESIIDIYAGLVFPAKIGDFVFLDQNANGLQDDDEPGLPMLKVILYDESGMKLDSVITDIQGLYSFTDLDPANYYIQVEYPDAIQPTVALSMMPALNSDITEANGIGTTDLVFLGSGVCNEDIDAGFVPTGAVIVGEVWLDTDENDIQDNPNNPVEGVTVNLFEVGATTPITTVSNEFGIYGFSSIPTGSYFVEFVIPDSLDFVNPNVGPADTDSDVTNIMMNGSTDPFIVLDGVLYDNVDAGVRDVRSTIDGQLFIDTNGDGIKDNNNQGLAGVDVILYDISGNEVASTITAADGTYTFDDLLAGDYFVEFSNYPPTYFFTEAFVGTDVTIDSDVDNTNGTGTTPTITLAYDDLITLDGGMYELASVGDYVWIDANEDGLQDPSELPQEGVVVQAIDANAMIAGTATTDSDGLYLIDGLVPGTYSLVFMGLDNYILTSSDVGSDDTIDSDVIAQGAQGVTGSFDIASGEVNLDFDAGYIFSQPADGVISGVAWTDSDGNGIRESSNPLLENIVVQLFDDMGVLQASDMTNVDGEYAFTGLVEGDYYVVFQAPIGTSSTLANVGSDITDSDITDTNGANSTDIITLGPSQTIANVDGGFISVGAIGNQVFVDVNGNGRKGGNEPGLNGVTVKLYDATTDMLLQTTVTQSDIATMSDGIYLFNDVPLGTYYVVFELPDPYLFTGADSGSNDELDSDVTEGLNGPGSTDDFSLVSGQVRTDIDAGAFLPAQLGDFVWDDLDADGIQDPGEPGIANVDVVLKRSNGLVIASTTTDAQGLYCFDGLKQGLYLIEFEVPQGYVVSPMNAGNDTAVDSDADATGATLLFSLAHGTSFKNVDAGFYAQNENNLRSHVWFDENGDGLFQLGEFNIKDVVVTLLDDQGVMVAQEKTNQAGRYAFIDIPDGDYQISVGVDDGFATTIMNAGNNDLIDSDVNAEGMSAMFTVSDGLSVPNIDVGIVDDDGFTPEMSDGDIDVLDSNPIENSDLGQEDTPIEFVSGPNPFYNRVQLRMSRVEAGIAYSILRLDGALVQSGSITEKDQWIELEGQNDGMYILIVTHHGIPLDKQYLMKVN